MEYDSEKTEADVKRGLAADGEDWVKYQMAGLDPQGILWLANAIEALQAEWKGLLAGEGESADLGATCAREFLAVVKATEQAVRSGQSIDGGPVEAPPINIVALRVMFEFYVEEYGVTGTAWANFCDAVRFGHFKKRMKGQIPRAAEMPTAGMSGAGGGCSPAILISLLGGAASMYAWL